MTLADSQIIQHWKDHETTPLVQPMNPRDIQPASIDLHLGHLIRIPRTDIGPHAEVDPELDNPADYFTTIDLYELPGRFYAVPAGGIFLASTFEYINIPVDMEGELHGISSIGRWFVQVHMTAGYFDPGFHGDGVMEGLNNLPWKFRIRAGMRISQLRVSRVEGQVLQPYGSARNHYQGQSGPVGSQIAGEDTWQGR